VRSYFNPWNGESTTYPEKRFQDWRLNYLFCLRNPDTLSPTLPLPIEPR